MRQTKPFERQTIESERRRKAQPVWEKIKQECAKAQARADEMDADALGITVEQLRQRDGR